MPPFSGWDFPSPTDKKIDEALSDQTPPLFIY